MAPRHAPREDGENSRRCQWELGAVVAAGCAPVRWGVAE